jgi:5,10-methylenetetrahydrofolate reductase
MGRVDREHALAENQRQMAQVEQAQAEHHDKNEHVHFRAMKKHERSAEIHDAIAALLPRDA